MLYSLRDKHIIVFIWDLCDWNLIFIPRSSGFEENLEVQGELILQDSFQVWDPRSLIRKGRDRHLFLFEFSLVFSKDIKDSAGRTKYQYKNRLLVGKVGTAATQMELFLTNACLLFRFTADVRVGGDRAH